MIWVGFLGSIGRSVHIVNLDQAAENFKYLLAIDIRELISLEYVTRGAPGEFGDKVGVPTEFQPSFRGSGGRPVFGHGGGSYGAGPARSALE